MKMKFNFKLSRPGLIATVAYTIMVIILLLPFDISTINPNIKKKYDFKYRLLLLCILMIPIGFSVYSINCMMVGKCIVWSYIQSIAITLWVMLFITATLLYSE
jgi:hypothetical protein